ncbi:zinc-dependent alcohol dehydrogenase [Halorubrum vacuolatum]|uniref:Threonine 3-dehydrogenase n=1 Tax=Halorubrum vacuolatum TaxID=63740 RepID=A0A238WIF1_HALVU|nr:alcohol dehydrogenase catalytic domain-containing protein [Halorubrum vacuolatum]SNR46342.1 threonine 3-dehydrogenase [Halorubrum vacuolatum]
MQAVVIDGFGSARISDVERPTPNRGEVLIRVERVQLSVTECSLYRGMEVAHYDAVAEAINGAADGTRLFGHEFVGEVIDRGAAVESLAVGDRVYAPGKIHCGTCSYCRSGHANGCVDTVAIGYDRPGALAEYLTLPVEPLRRVPEGVSAPAAAALQPLASSVLCMVDADIDPGDDVAVLGAGVMGFQCGVLARRFGADRVFAVDVRDRPLEVAAECGLVPIDARTTDPVAAMRDRTDGLGVDVAIEAVGGDQSHGTVGDDPLAQAYRAVRGGGTILQVGHITGDLSVRPRSFRSKSIDWVNPRKGVADLTPRTDTATLAARLVADGDVPIDRYVTHELDGLDAFERAVEITLAKDEHDALGPAQIVL